VLLVLSDFEDNTSHQNLDKAILDMQLTGTAVFAFVNFAKGHESDRSARLGAKVSRRMAEETGGECYLIKSPQDMQAALRDGAADEGAPVEERMQALLSLAVLDYAHNRAADAVARFNHLLGYYQHTGNTVMQAFVLNGLGDVARRQGDADGARHWYECAVPPAIEGGDPIVLSGVVRNLGEAAYQRRQYAEAEQYFDHLHRLTAVTLDADGKARALEWRGLSQEKQGDPTRAAESWETAAEFCRKSWAPGLRPNLEHLARVYQQQRRGDRLAAVQAELRALNRG